MNALTDINLKADATRITDQKQRYSAGVLKYRQMGYWEPDYVPRGHRHDLPVPHHAAGGRGSDRGRRRRGRRVEHRHLDGGLDRPPHGLRELPRQVLQGRAGAGPAGRVLRLGGLRHHPVRGRLDRQHDGEPDRQRLLLQAAEGRAPGRHPHPGGLREDLQGPAHRPGRRARAAGQVRPTAAGRHHQAQARPLRRATTAA